MPSIMPGSTPVVAGDAFGDVMGEFVGLIMAVLVGALVTVVMSGPDVQPVISRAQVRMERVFFT
jgi:hypothetical protein